MRFRSLLLLALLGLLLSGGLARADYQFLFTDSSGNAANAFSVNQGSTVDISVYFAQTGSTAGLSDSGLAAGGVKLTYDQTIADVTSKGAITPNSAFDAATKNLVIGSASLNLNQLVSSPVTALTSGADANRILLGTFTFTGVSAGSTLTLTALPGSGADNVLGDGQNGGPGTNIDSLITNSSAAVTVVAVPEPSMLVLTGLFAAGMAGAAWRRHRRRPA